MKSYSDYTEMELANMTSEQIETLIDIECMTTGAPLSISEPIYMEVPEVEPPKETVYALSVGDVLLTSKEEAESLLFALNSLETRVKTDYNYSNGYKRRYIVPKEHDEVIRKEMYYSKSAYSNISQTLCAVKEAEAENEKRKEAYKKSCEKRNEVVSEVMGAYYNALDYKRNVEEAKRVFEKYIDLSGGVYETAIKFFEQSEFSEYIDEVKGMVKDGKSAEL